MLYIPLVLPLGPLVAFLNGILESARKRIGKVHKSPFETPDSKHFGFEEAKNLPLPENEAYQAALKQIAAADFEGAKQTLVDAWQQLPSDESSEMAYLRLREGFVKLYAAKGEAGRAAHISTLPSMILGREVQWIVTHPDAQIGGCGTFTESEQIESAD